MKAVRRRSRCASRNAPSLERAPSEGVVRSSNHRLAKPVPNRRMDAWRVCPGARARECVGSCTAVYTRGCVRWATREKSAKGAPCSEPEPVRPVQARGRVAPMRHSWLPCSAYLDSLWSSPSCPCPAAASASATRLPPTSGRSASARTATRRSCAEAAASGRLPGGAVPEKLPPGCREQLFRCPRRSRAALPSRRFRPPCCP